MLLIVIASTAVVGGQSPRPKSPGLPAGAIPIRPVDDPSVRVGWRRYDIGTKPILGVVLPSPPGVTAETLEGQQVNTFVSTNRSGVYAAVRIDRIPVNLENAS